jgi:hypothetical protein
MSSTGAGRTVTLAAALLLLAVATVGEAQVLSYATTTRVDDGEADRLQRRAEALHDQPGRWTEVGDLYTRAASLRTPGDARAIDAWLTASRVYHHAGRAADAVRVLRLAAEAALATGDVVRAAHSFTDEAWVLARMNRKAEAAEVLKRAELLTRSPLLRESEQRELRRRIDAR